MALSESDIIDIAEYVRIGLSDDEVKQMTVDLNKIIDTLKLISEYDLEGVKPTFHPIGKLSNVMRPDCVGKSFSQELALSNSDSTKDGCFEIPSILGGRGSLS